MTHKDGRYQSKVDRLLSKYELHDLGDKLEERWTRQEKRSSLRDLAEYFNRQLLATAIEQSELEALDGDIDNLYRILTEDDVSSGTRQETRRHLTQHGIDVKSLEADFVTYQAIRTYLRNYRNVESPQKSHDINSHRDAKRQTIQRLMSRLNTVTAKSLVELKNADHLTLGEFEVIVSVDIHCSDCKSRLSITKLLSNGSCKCN